MPPTVYDIAKHVNLSPSLVSRVLRNGASASASAKTNARIMDAARTLGYTPNRAARALATGRTGVVAVVLYWPHKSHFAEELHYLEDELREGGLSVIIDRRTPEEAGVGATDAIVLLDCASKYELYRDHYGAACPPIISAGVYCVDVGDRVQVDLASGTVDAMAHFVSRGCRRIALCAEAVVIHPPGDRAQAYIECCCAHSIEPEFILLQDQDIEDAYGATVSCLRNGSPPDAILCFNDDVAFGVSRALTDAGLRIPHDVALVGCDDISYAKYHNPPLSTITIPVDELAKATAKMVIARLENPELPEQHYQIVAQFTERASSHWQRRAL